MLSLQLLEASWHFTFHDMSLMLILGIRCIGGGLGLRVFSSFIDWIPLPPHSHPNNLHITHKAP